MTATAMTADSATMSWVSLSELLAVAHNAPDLQDAACVGRAAQFDVDGHDRHAVAEAKAVCAGCAALTACRDWLEATPKPLRPSGVVAGQLMPPPRPSRAAAERKPRPPTKQEQAGRWLRRWLELRGGTGTSTQVFAAGAAASHDRRSLQAACHDIGVVRERIPNTVGGARIWTLPTTNRRTPMTDYESMTPEEFTLALVPNADDSATAGAWLAAQTRLDPMALLAIYTDTVAQDRLFQLLTALAETAVRAVNLRDEPTALPRLLAELNKHALNGEEPHD